MSRITGRNGIVYLGVRVTPVGWVTEWSLDFAVPDQDLAVMTGATTLEQGALVLTARPLTMTELMAP